MAGAIGIDVLFGYLERDGEALYSSCALIKDGCLAQNYRRISRGWKEFSRTDDHYREGDAVQVFDYRGIPCAIALCGDLWDSPERFALGESLLFWPVYTGWTAEQWNGSEREEYARQAALCCERVLFINSICEGDSLGGAADFIRGSVASELPIGREGLLLIDC